MLWAESYSAVYSTNAYQLPANRGLTDSYMNYQMYNNQPGYNARMGHYGGDDPGLTASNSMYNSAALLTREYWVI